MLIQLSADRGQQVPTLIIDRTHSTEVVVVLGHFQHPLTRHVLSTKDVFEKRHHVVRTFRSTERNKKNGVVRRLCTISIHVSRITGCRTRRHCCQSQSCFCTPVLRPYRLMYFLTFSFRAVFSLVM